ncbi:hypothetical protein A4D02_22740 [Niastella koreensis]|uniref:DNA helicase n=2 Tax=Niastella koreensis TaxID=354356 RepID=G8TEC1_NIAKG|nr:ATP-dependent helicase [Niastella koreensis]AEV98331.1 hypothetical protein Niako_1976 [Niastella koreensis GR20-10]OQP53213.1 hypothetical protein A4D02_22740 [Niastella koreensis]
MTTIDSQKAQAFYAELILIQHSKAEPTERFSNLSSAFYKLIKTSTNEELVAFRNFYARFRYLLSQLNMSVTERQNLDAFRRFIKEGNINKTTPKAIQQGIALLYRLVKLLSNDKTNTKELDTLPYSDGYFLKLVPQRKYDTLTNLKILVAAWSEITDYKGNACFTLQGYDLENMEGLVEILVKAQPHANLTPIRQLLTPGAILQLQNITYTGKAGNQYTTTYESLIALEPDFLVDATAVGECFLSAQQSSSDLFFLGKVVDELPGIPALKGSMVGYFLDEIVRDKKQDLEAVYKKAQKSNALKAAQFGNLQMQLVKQSIFNEHLKNIKTLVETQKGKEIWIEPTYFSKEFGLQGRIDLLGINKKLNSKDIVELKSGSPTNHVVHIARVNHKMQVVCYDLLLQSTYGQNRQGANAVFYSQCTTLPYRSIVSERGEKIDVLHIRNEITAKIYQLANGDFSLLRKIKHEGVTDPGFKRDQLTQFRAHYDPSRIASQYYEELLAFTLREMINAKVGDMLKEDREDNQNGFAGLWLDNQLAKEQDFRILFDMNIKQIDEENGQIHLTYNNDIPHSFRKGDLVILYPRSEDGYSPLKQHILKGTLSALGLNSMTINLFNIQTDYTFLRAHQYWAIEPDILERNNWSTISSLFNILCCSDRKKKLLFGHEEPKSETSISYNNQHLTSKQNQVIQQALNARDYYLLQGPPGTGKTSTFLVNYMQEQICKTKDKIIVLAFTNKAVDKICESFNKPINSKYTIPYLRLGTNMINDEHLFTKRISGDNPDTWKQLIDSHQVIVSTVATFQNNWLLLKKLTGNFNQVIIDEASQLTEATLAGILVLFEKFILIGDHKQLPSVVTQDAKTCITGNKYLNNLGVTDLRTSLFERLTRNAINKKWGNAYGQLTHHYRMHEDIAGLISQHYREPLMSMKLQQKTKAAPYKLTVDDPLFELTASRIVFIESIPENALKKNEQEAIVAAFITQHLIDTGIVTPAEIGIVTPFRAQIAEIKRHLRPDILLNENFIIDTVERYQGDERKIILFSSTVCHARQIPSMQSIAAGDTDKTDRKLLVSISRASEQFILLGNSAVLRTSKQYQELILQIESKNGFIDKQFSENIITYRELIAE